MQIGTKKKVFVAISMMALTAALYSYMEYTRGGKDLMDARADHITIAKDFIREFEENEKAANEKFINKIIVKDVIKDDDKFYPIILEDSNSTSSVRCNENIKLETC